MDETPLLSIRNLKKYYPLKHGLLSGPMKKVWALDGINMDILPGETLGLVGESGCGKTTLGKMILRLEEPTSGEIYFHGENILQFQNKAMRKIRRKMQIIFQNPFASLNPKKNINQILREPFLIHKIMRGKELDDRIHELLKDVGLRSDALSRYPHEFSGGQRQRIGIARALALRPELIILDEPVSALDVSIQAQIINLMKDLQEKYNLTYLFISHDLSIVEHISKRVAVMYLGNIVEIAPVKKLYSSPLHPYTHALLSACPTPDPNVKKKRNMVFGEPPSPLQPPSGCKFHPRCPKAMDICTQNQPDLIPVAEDYAVRCFLYESSSFTGSASHKQKP